MFNPSQSGIRKSQMIKLKMSDRRSPTASQGFDVAVTTNFSPDKIR
jgi:hypothetical protein